MHSAPFPATVPECPPGLPCDAPDGDVVATLYIMDEPVTDLAVWRVSREGRCWKAEGETAIAAGTVWWLGGAKLRPAGYPAQEEYAVEVRRGRVTVAGWGR